MEGLGVLLFIVFAVLAALSNAKKTTGRGTGVPRPGTRWPPRDAVPGPPSAGDAGEESAVTLVPDDLWAILTGERPPSAPPPHPAPASRTPLPEAEQPAEWNEDSSLERQGPEVAWRAEPPRDVVPVTKPSLPPPPLPAAPVLAGAAESETAVAVASSQAASADMAPAPLVAPGSFGVSPPPRPLDARGLLATPGDLRRAFVLREVLGPPKALE